MIALGFKATKANFFDRRKVHRAVDGATRRVLARFGAFVRRRAKSSIRKRKATSLPGSPPSSHTGKYRDLIFFAYDVPRRSVVIGPTQSRPDSSVPRLLEHGGVALRRTRTGTVELHYRARPHMGPAFEAEIPSLPPLWRNAVR